MTGKRHQGAKATALLVGVFALAVVATTGLTMVEAQQRHDTEAALAADALNLTTNYRFRTEHRAATEAVRDAFYADAWTDHTAAQAAAQAALTAASGKVDTTASAQVITDASLIGDRARLTENTRLLAAEAQTVTDAVAAYDAEQARLAEERAAAERVTGRRAPVSADDSGSQGSGGGSGVDHVEYVAGWGGQGLIDACVGSVFFDGYGGQGIVEHWSCGGSEFPQWPGAIVEIPGYGIYEVQGILTILDASVNDTSDLPGGFFYQTCLGGSTSTMAFIGLSQVG